MPPIQYIVEGGHRLKGAIEPSGNKNAALPIIAAALLTEHPVTLDNVPRIRDTETLVELIRSVGASAEWRGRNRLAIHARDIRAADLDPDLCARIRASILLAGPLVPRRADVTQPEQCEVGSRSGPAAVTRSPMRIMRAGVEHLRSIRMGFERLGIVCEVAGDDLIVPSEQTLKIKDDFGGHVPKLEDQPWPALPADLMSIAIVTATQCDG